MKHKGLLLTIINVAIYVAAAFVIFAWLVIRASNGGLFSPAAGTYKVVVPSAPAVEANKTSIITESGVTVGVVTSVELQEDGALLELKITDPGPVTVKRDGGARIVIMNIIGEKGVQIVTGDDDEKAVDGQMLAFAGESEVLEASDALAPFEDIQGARDNPELKDFLGDQTALVEESQDEAEAIVTNVSELVDVVAAQKVALDSVGRRTSDMLSVLAQHGGDIQNLVEESAGLAAAAETLLDDELVILEKGFTFAADTLELLANRATEMNTVLQRLPEIAEDMNYATSELLRLLHNEGGHFVYISAWNVPNLELWLQILEEGHR